MMGPVYEDDSTPSDFTHQISEMLKLGYPCSSGSFGVVYRCPIESSKGTMEVTVKVFKVDSGRAVGKTEKAINQELMVLHRLKHATIVPLLGTAHVESPFPALVSQWISSQSLYMYLEKEGMIAASAKVGLAIGIADGLKYRDLGFDNRILDAVGSIHDTYYPVHSNNVIHGDLHPANVLIDGSGNPRLTDFGLATVVGDAGLQLFTMTTNHSLDSRWHAPEVIGINGDPEKPSFKSDIYSFGGVMFFITSGDAPWKEKKHSRQISIELSKRAIHARPDNILDRHWNLIQQCWSWHARDRPGAAEIIGCIARKNIVLFGETGAGKSSLANLMAGHEVVHTSPSTQRCMMQWKEYMINFGDGSYKVFETIGLEEPQLGI
ncbi:kinase-like domain-containing protein [Suillus ampliporus]|nr:kinase-like domain-containing protein [Suillus ampliporus]